MKSIRNLITIVKSNTKSESQKSVGANSGKFNSCLIDSGSQKAIKGGVLATDVISF